MNQGKIFEIKDFILLLTCLSEKTVVDLGKVKGNTWICSVVSASGIIIVVISISDESPRSNTECFLVVTKYGIVGFQFNLENNFEYLHFHAFVVEVVLGIWGDLINTQFT